ncbi:DNA polymerase III, subunits gamma and tau, partial [Operophtera brumata]
EEMKKINDYHHNVSQSRVNGPHSKYPSSATENMKESTQTKIEIVILMCNPRQTKAASKAASAPAPAK